MTGFRGQKFDFVGHDNVWYALVSDLPYMHINMRITSPVPSVPEITYITGLSIVTKDTEGLEHTIIISVSNPHSLESSCPVGTSPCLADGALHVTVDGEEVLIAPGDVTVARDVSIAAVNLPGACRSFGFEKYWERKKLENFAQSSRKLSLRKAKQDMSDWVLADPTVTDKAECAEYIAQCTSGDGVGLFEKQSEHVSFQITIPTATIRLSHGRLHQLPMRDPTDHFDLPDHLTWQMNMAIDHHEISLDATGILGETLVPTVSANGTPIMQGMGAIRGTQEDCEYANKRYIVTVIALFLTIEVTLWPSLELLTYRFSFT